MEESNTESLFSVSTQPQAELIAKLESAANNIIYSDRPGKDREIAEHSR
jgi:hypothetical protein